VPSRKTHNIIAQALGIPLSLADEVNRDMDAPSRETGPSHRRYRHDVNYAIREGVKYRTPLAMAASLLHSQVDRTVSSDPRLRKLVEIIEALSD
jgi:hypothetical protein